MSTFRYRTRQYDTTTGALIGPGPIPKTLEAGSPLNDVPSMSVTFNDPQNIILAPAELSVEVSFDDGQTWTEPPNMRFAIIGNNRDRITSPKYPSLKAVGMFWQLRKAVINAVNGPFDADGRRAWANITPGALIRTLIQEAQDRGVLPWLDVSSFTSFVDSNGVAWPTTFSTSHEIGIGYDACVIALADAGLIDFVMQGRSLHVYVADTYLAPANNGVTLIEGKDFTEASEEVTYELVASKNLIKGDGISTVVTDAAADKPWGEWEVTTSASGSTDLADLNTLADLGSARSSLRQTQRTYTVYPNASPTSPKPWSEYKLGDKVNAQTANQLELDLRIRQMTLRGDGNSSLVTLVLGDRLLEREVRLQRMLKATSGGVAGAGGGGSTPPNGDGTGGVEPPTDNTIPKPPTGLGLSSTAVLINNAIVSDITASWVAPTQNTNNTILDDLEYYEVQTKRTVLSNNYWEAGGTTTNLVLTVGALVPGASYDVRVRAVDKFGNYSTWTVATITTNMDGVAPNKPSTPTVVPDLGLLFVYWDGKDEFGNAMPADFAEMQIHVSTTSAFTPDGTTYRDSIVSQTGGRSPIGDLTYGTSYFIKLVAVDWSGNASVPSDQASGIPARVTGLDIEALTIETTNLGPNAVTEAKIVNLAVTTAKMADLSVINAKIANLAVDDAKIANLNVGKLVTGTLTADITLSSRIMTAATGVRTMMSAVGIEAYNSSNQRTFFANAANGNVTMTGIFSTNISGQRIVIDDGGFGTIYFYPSAGSDYAFINAPSQNSVGVNSGNGGGPTRSRIWTLPTAIEMKYMNLDQSQAGGWITCNNTGVTLSALYTQAVSMSVVGRSSMVLNDKATIIGQVGVSLTADGGPALFGSNNNRFLQFIGGGATTLNSGGGSMTITSSNGAMGIDSGSGNLIQSGGYVQIGAPNNRYIILDASSNAVFRNAGSNITLTGTTVEINGTAVRTPFMPTTSLGANMYLAPSTGQFYYNSSSRKIKSEIQEIDPRAYLEHMDDIQVVTFRDKRELEEKGESPLQIGLIAEQILGIPHIGEILATMNRKESGETLLPSVHYDRGWLLLLLDNRELRRQVELMKHRIDELEEMF